MKVPYKERLEVEALLLWSKYHLDYQSLREDYEDLLMQKRVLGIRPLHKIKDSALAEWIEIPFLALSTEGEVAEFLSGCSAREIAYVISEIVVLRDSYIWHTLKTRIADYTYELYRYSCPKVVFAINPDGISNRYYGATRHSEFEDR